MTKVVISSSGNGSNDSNGSSGDKCISMKNVLT